MISIYFLKLISYIIFCAKHNKKTLLVTDDKDTFDKRPPGVIIREGTEPRVDTAGNPDDTDYYDYLGNRDYSKEKTKSENKTTSSKK